MKTFMTSLCAAAITVSLAGTSAAQTAGSPFQTIAPPASEARVIQVQGRDYYGSPRQWDRGDFRRYHRKHYRGHIPRYRGHRGYHRYRPGYRRHGDFWYPAAAFIAGAIISGAINNNSRTVYRGNAHVEWCYDRYRSYRASDNTFQPYHGPRKQCYSPYS